MKQLNMREELLMKHFQNIELPMIKMFNKRWDRFITSIPTKVSLTSIFLKKKVETSPFLKGRFTFLDTPLTCRPSYTVVFNYTHKNARPIGP
jgi:hypothetical protein